MAVIWQHLETPAGGTSCLYQVRSAGRTRRLYTNGVFHSQYNPSSPVAGSVWDLLLLPAFMQRLCSVKRVLVLGVGGGAVIKQLQHFLSPEAIVGVELNPVHLEVATRFFGVKGVGVELIHADAVTWLERYKGPDFDLIIDDLFGEIDGEPSRAVAADSQWCGVLLKHLAEDGALVMNFDEASGLKRCAFLDKTETGLLTKAHWKDAWCFSTPLYSNAIGCFSRQRLGRSDFRAQLQGFRELDERRAGCKLKYQLTPLRYPHLK